MEVLNTTPHILYYKCKDYLSDKYIIVKDVFVSDCLVMTPDAIRVTCKVIKETGLYHMEIGVTRTRHLTEIIPIETEEELFLELI